MQKSLAQMFVPSVFGLFMGFPHVCWSRKGQCIISPNSCGSHTHTHNAGRSKNVQCSWRTSESAQYFFFDLLWPVLPSWSLTKWVVCWIWQDYLMVWQEAKLGQIWDRFDKWLPDHQLHIRATSKWRWCNTHIVTKCGWNHLWFAKRKIQKGSNKSWWCSCVWIKLD